MAPAGVAPVYLDLESNLPGQALNEGANDPVMGEILDKGGNALILALTSIPTTRSCGWTNPAILMASSPRPQPTSSAERPGRSLRSS